MSGEVNLEVEAERRPTVYRFGDWTLDPRIARLTRSGATIEIEPRVLRLLQVLVEERDRLVTKQELLDRVWDGAYVSDNALTRAAARLRSVLGDEARAPRFVQTVHRQGYRFIADVEAVGRERSQEVAVPSAGRGRRWGVLAAATLLGSLALGLLGYRFVRPGDGNLVSAVEAAPAPLDPRRIAVLPLAHVGPDAAEAYLAEGFTEQLVSTLTRTDALRVVARASTRAFDDVDSGAGAIGHALGAGSILEGSVRSAGERLRITLRLVDTTTEELRWTREFDTAVADLFAVQEQITVEVAKALETSIAPDRLSRLGQPPTADPTAYDLYLRGRRAYRERTRAGNEEAIHRYRQALALDADFALAEAGLANAYALRVLRWNFPDDWFARAEEAAQRALALDPDLPQALKASAMVAQGSGRLEESLALNLQALQRDPDFDEALYNGASIASTLGQWDLALELQSRDGGPIGRMGLPTYLFMLGFDDAGRSVAEAVLADEPLANYTQLNLAYINMLTGEYEEARTRLASMRAAFPSWSRVWRQSGEVEMWADDLDAALPFFEQAHEQAEGGSSDAAVRAAWILAVQDRHDEADVLLDAVVLDARQWIDDGSVSWWHRWRLAAVASVRRQPDALFEWLIEAHARGFNLLRQHRSDPLFAAYHDDPRYQALGDTMVGEIEAMRVKIRPTVVGLGLPVD